jgi:hypothetical protein
MLSGTRAFACAPILALLLGATFPALPGLAQPANSRRTVVVGDIHGDLEGLTGILRQAGIIDTRNRWTAGNTIVVQIGDQTDRGARVREVLDLLMDLERQANAAGGRLIVLLGNHEAMNLAGNFRDVSTAAYASFADARSENRRRSAYEAYVRLVETRAEMFAGKLPPAFQAVSRDEWMATHPPGALEYREAFGPSGRYGRWLRQKSAVLQLGDIAFMHAGINPATAPPRLEDINKQVSDDIRKLDEHRRRMTDRNLILPWFGIGDVLLAAQLDLQNFGDLMQIDSWSMFDPEGPMWFRGFANWSAQDGPTQIKTLLQRYKLSHFVVGHTVTSTRRVTPQFANAVFLIDTGMIFSGGVASALEIQGGRFTAISADGRTLLE